MCYCSRITFLSLMLLFLLLFCPRISLAFLQSFIARCFKKPCKSTWHWRISKKLLSLNQTMPYITSACGECNDVVWALYSDICLLQCGLCTVAPVRTVWPLYSDTCPLQCGLCTVTPVPFSVASVQWDTCPLQCGLYTVTPVPFSVAFVQ